MDNSELTQVNLTVSANGATEEDVDNMTRQLLSELRELDIDSAELVKGESAPMGTKGDPITIGSIALAVLPNTLPSVVALVQDWMARREGRMVEFQGGGMTFKGPPEAFQQALATFAAQKRGKPRKASSAGRPNTKRA